MIERSVIKDNKKELQIEEFISQNLKNVGLSKVKLQKTPLGEKIIIYTSRPGLVVGRKGESISRLSVQLKEHFKLDNPQIEISEVESPNLDPRIVAERIASNMERFGSRRFKAIMHKMMELTMHSGALGIEITVSGKVPSQRARTWRVFQGYLKKCGYIAQHDVRIAYAQAHLKTGVVGIKVSIMPNIKLPYDVAIYDEEVVVVEEAVQEAPKPKKAPTKRKAPVRRKAPAKKTDDGDAPAKKAPAKRKAPAKKEAPEAKEGDQ